MQMTDVPAFAAYRSDPEVARFQGWTSPYPLQSAERVIRRLIEMHGPQMKEFYTMAIVDPIEDTLLGDLSMKWEWDGLAVEVGYTLAREHQGRGYAFEALDTLLRYLFTATPLQRAQGAVHPENYASARLLERSGFTYEGTTRMGYWVEGVGADDDRYGVLRDEWFAWRDRSLAPARAVHLDLITPDNVTKVRMLKVHRTQEKLVANPTESLADAQIPDVMSTGPAVPWYRAVVADEQIVGFVMVDIAPGRPPTLWRLLIDRWHQHRGIGSAVVALVAEHARTVGATQLLVSWVPGPGSPETFYRGLGFSATGEFDGDEIVAALPL